MVAKMEEAVDKATQARAKGESASDYDAEFDRIELLERDLARQIRQAEFAEREAKEKAERHLEDLDKEKKIPGGSGAQSEYRDALRAYVQFGIQALSNEQRTLLNTAVSMLPEHRAQSVGTNSAGGFLVAQDFMPEIESAIKDYSGVMQVARMITTSTGAPLPWPTSDATARKAAIIAENTQSTGTDFAFGQKTMNAYMYRDMNLVPLELIQDSEFNLNQWIPDQFAESFGRALNEHFTTGDNSNKPNGVLTASTLGKAAASATAFTREEIVDLIHQVNSGYRMSRSCGFMFSDQILAEIKKLSFGSADDRPLWQPSIREGAPDKLEGFPYWVNDDMPTAQTTGQKIILFGDFSKYIIRQVRGMFIRRLEERFIDYGQVGFIAFARYDGELINTAAVKHLVLA